MVHNLQIYASHFLLIIFTWNILSPNQGFNDVVKTAFAAEFVHQVYEFFRDAVVSSW